MTAIDPLTLLKSLAPSLVAALAVMVAACGAGWALATNIPGLKKRAARVQMAFASLGASGGFCAGYAMLFVLPKNSADLAWKMIFFAALVGGLLTAIARLLPRWWSAAMLGIAAAAVTLITVYGPWHGSEDRVWPGWACYAAALAAIGFFCGAELGGRTRASQPAAFAGPVVVWASCAAASFTVLAAVDQRLGKMLILLSVLAGASCMLFFVRRIRPMAAGAAAMVAILSAAVLATSAYYNETLPIMAFVLLGIAPLSAAVAWLPWLQKRPAACVVLAFVLAVGVLCYPVIMGIRHMPEMP